MNVSITDLQHAFLGLDTAYPLADGTWRRRRYLDSAASSLMLEPAWQTARAFLNHYANTHSDLHFGARIATNAYAWAHERALAFVGADPTTFACAFVGSGSTSGFNRLARALKTLRPERTTVLVSEMEHHSNDLPHRKHTQAFEHIPLLGAAPATGCIDLCALERMLETHRGNVRYVAITAASNVTGILNPIRAIAELVHAHDAWLVVDGSQAVMHVPIAMQEGIDFLVFSGHKVYAPGSPGVLIGRRDLLAAAGPDEVGGGIVDDVSLRDYIVADRFPDREEAGTPNIVGAVLLGAALESLMRIGMTAVRDHEQQLLGPTLAWLAEQPYVRVYGDTDLVRTPRTGTIAFNLRGIDHALVAAVLNDYWGIAVRNACFCAHPYVREMLKPELWELDAEFDTETAAGLAALKRRSGMVRVSMGLYTTSEDLDVLKHALATIAKEPEHFRAQYDLQPDGNYAHRTAHRDGKALFDPDVELAKHLARAANDGAPRKSDQTIPSALS